MKLFEKTYDMFLSYFWLIRLYKCLCYKRLINFFFNTFLADGILLGGILFMYEFHYYLKPILLLVYSFWIPQIITNIVRDSRKPLHPHYILGITVTRLAIPLYVFGCPNNFLRIEPDHTWCACLVLFTVFQAAILLLQHYLGSRWFIPHQVRPKSCRAFLLDRLHPTI